MKRVGKRKECDSRYLTGRPSFTQSTWGDAPQIGSPIRIRRQPSVQLPNLRGGTGRSMTSRGKKMISAASGAYGSAPPGPPKKAAGAPSFIHHPESATGQRQAQRQLAEKRKQQQGRRDRNLVGLLPANVGRHSQHSSTSSTRSQESGNSYRRRRSSEGVAPPEAIFEKGARATSGNSMRRARSGNSLGSLSRRATSVFADDAWAQPQLPLSRSLPNLPSKSSKKKLPTRRRSSVDDYSATGPKFRASTSGTGWSTHMAIDTSKLTPSMRRRWHAEKKSTMQYARRKKEPWDRDPHYTPKSGCLKCDEARDCGRHSDSDSHKGREPYEDWEINDPWVREDRMLRRVEAVYAHLPFEPKLPSAVQLDQRIQSTKAAIRASMAQGDQATDWEKFFEDELQGIIATIEAVQTVADDGEGYADEVFL